MAMLNNQRVLFGDGLRIILVKQCHKPAIRKLIIPPIYVIWGMVFLIVTTLPPINMVSWGLWQWFYRINIDKYEMFVV